MYKGAFSPTITLFDQEGEIDYHANEAHIKNLIAGGIDGFLFLGSIGEFYNLSVIERKSYVDFVIEVVNGKVPVLVGTGGTNIREVIELSSHAQKTGANAVVIIQPYYMKKNENSVYAFYDQIARSVNIDIFLYNFPDATGFNVPPELISKLAQKFNHIIGIKDTVDNISHTRQIIDCVRPLRPEFIVFSGYDEYLLQNMIYGGNGVISGLTNVAPELFKNLTNAIEANDFAKLKKLSEKLKGLMSLYTKTDSFIAAIKTAASMNMSGICTNLREPGCYLDKAMEQEIFDYVKNILSDG